MKKERDESIEFINEESPYREKAVEAERTTMSVPELGKLLGLKKTDSYWLVHKNVFETVLVSGKMRIKLDSFEKWYSMQVKYKKTDGTPPGQALRELSYSVQDIAGMLQISTTTVYEIINRNHLETIVVDYWKRVPKDVFERWYDSQNHYRTPEDRERDAQLEQDTVSMPEIAWLLGIHRKEVYSFLNAKENEGRFRFVMLADRKRITRDSFMRWLRMQEKYHILTIAEREKLERERAEAEEKLHPKEPKNPKFYTVDEINYFFGIHRATVYKWIREGTIAARRVGKSWRIDREEFDDWIDFRSC